MESNPNVVLPLGLRRSLESGECVLFIGAGIGTHTLGSDGQPSPDGTLLAKELANMFSISTTNYDLSKIAQVIENRVGRPELETFLQKRLAKLEPDTDLRWLFSLRWKAIFTTNYDRVIERAYDLNSSPAQNPVSIGTSPEIVDFNPRFDIPVYHLHGCLFGTSKPHIVITENDYITFRDKRKMLFEILRREFATSTFLYIGYSNKDQNWKTVLEETKAEFFPSKMPLSYRVAIETDSLEKELLHSQGVETLELSIADFVSLAKPILAETKIDPERISRLKSKVPPDLIPDFEKNPAGMTRLLSCWTYVNQAAFDDKPNLASFLRGDRANWALIGKRLFFERDIEDQVFDVLLDIATGLGKKPRVVNVLGPAGYGMSTLLMSLAARLVKEHAGPVFWHIPNTPLREGDMEFAQSLFSTRSFFVIDNAADNIDAIRTTLQSFTDSEKIAGFLLGERLNEWRQAGWKIRGGDEFVLESLTDPEINRLLKFLEENQALDHLKDLDEDLRFAVIKEKHGKQLLVTLREAIEGNTFDAILEDEYRGIKEQKSKELYLAVSCFHQHDALARDRILADLLGVSLEDMYALTKDATEGVVIFECLDESYGHYAARTRHRIIAEIIWERCGSSGGREHLLQSVLNSINLNYRLDRVAFDRMIQSDRLIDSIKTLEGKIRFFETAVRKDPDNPYVHQHYSRMLLRERKSDLALGQIEMALKLASNNRILHHTKAVILRELAIDAQGEDIARKRLVQSEEEFRRCIAIYNKDEYSYQGLADLYLCWAKRSQSSDEAMAYIAKAEETIDEGLRKVRVRDGLWVVSSEVQKWLGDKPAHIHALEKAVSESPGSIVAPYLLGRAYRRNGELKKALDVLHNLVSKNPNEFRPCVEYAQALVESGEPYSKGIAVLRLGTLYGLSDSRFVATLGGMLFMNGAYTEASEIFSESRKHEIPAIEAQAIQYRPRNPNNLSEPVILTGNVLSLKPGFAFIHVPGYPNFFCPGSKYAGLILRPGLKVSFEPAFNARGAIAEKLKTA